MVFGTEYTLALEISLYIHSIFYCRFTVNTVNVQQTLLATLATLFSVNCISLLFVVIILLLLYQYTFLKKATFFYFPPP